MATIFFKDNEIKNRSKIYNGYHDDYDDKDDADDFELYVSAGVGPSGNDGYNDGDVGWWGRWRCK